MEKIKTYEFRYDESIDGFGEIQFCCENRDEAIELFNDWCKENNYTIGKYKLTTVFEQSDKDEYEDNYWM